MTVHVWDDGYGIIEHLFKTGAVGFNWGQGIRFKSGILSPGAYLNNRVLPSYPKEWDCIAAAMAEASPDDYNSYDVVAAVATGGIVHATKMVDKLCGYNPMVIVKKAEKDGYGLKGLIDGDASILPGARVLLVEDMSSTFGSSLKAMEPLEANGATVVHTIAISTWGFPVFYENTAEHDVTVLCSGEQLINYAASCKFISPKFAHLLHAWRKNPDDESWVSDEWDIPPQ